MADYNDFSKVGGYVSYGIPPVTSSISSGDPKLDAELEKHKEALRAALRGPNLFDPARYEARIPSSDDNSVDHPAHYTSHPSGVECIEVTEHHDFLVGNAIKYLWRAGLKGEGDKEIQDLKKAQWYIARKIQKLELAKEEAND